MALTKVDNICPLCGKEFQPEESAIYITKVNLTTNGRTGAGDGGMAFGGSYQKTPANKRRIKHLGSCKPRCCVHDACFQEKIAPVLNGKKKKK